jgi:NAD(P)-dependent dehydrogenase (short-subunit alcohol dehydrogenase family)
MNIVITGSTRGIGFGLALEFLKLGHNVTLNGTSEESLGKAFVQLSAYKKQITAVAGSILKAETHDQLFNQCVAIFGSVDIWINNAGITQSYQLADDLADDEMVNVIDINVTGMMLGTIHALRKMKQQGHGKIFNMEGFGSDGRMMKKMTIYGTSKSALRYFTRSMSKEVHNSNIQIGVLSPGMVITDLIINSLDTIAPEELEQTKKIFNILGEKVETVTPFLVHGMLKSTKNNDRIAYLSNGKVMWKFIRSLFVKNDYFG